MKRVATVIVALAALTVFAATAMAQEPVEYKVTVKGEVVKGSPSDHFVTFSGPVHVPNVTLPAGTYIFSLLGSSVVQVSSADRSQQFAMFFTTPVRRLDPSEQYEMTLAPTVERAPRRIAKWFLPYQSLGFEFLYSQEEGRGER